MVESILPILDEIVSDYSNKDQGYALSLRYSVGQLGMIVTVLSCPAIYNIRRTMIDPFWFMFAFVTFGFILSIAVVIADHKARRKVATPRSPAGLGRTGYMRGRLQGPRTFGLRLSLSHHLPGCRPGLRFLPARLYPEAGAMGQRDGQRTLGQSK